MFYQGKKYKGRGKTRMDWPGSFHKARAPDVLYSNAYARYSADEMLFSTWSDAGVFDAANVYKANSLFLPAGVAFQRDDNDGSSLFHAVQLNDPSRPLVVSPTFQVGATKYAARVGTFATAGQYPQAVMNIQQWARVYKYMAPYKTKIWVTFLPAAVDAAASAQLQPDDLNVDALRIYYQMRNPTTGDAAYLLNPNLSFAAQVANPYTWNSFINPSTIQATSEIKSIPLSSPNTIGGGTTIKACWSLRNQKERNVNYMLKNVCTSTGQEAAATWQRPSDLTSAELPSPTYWFQFGVGTDIGTAAAQYKVRFKVQIKWYYKCWELRTDVKSIVNLWSQLTAMNSSPVQEEDDQEEMLVDQESQGTYPSVPSTPVIEQLTRELAQFGHAKKVLPQKKA